ncbi:MAG: hypothetical protein A4S17_09530 [Proteobacteria bacterium HN_bin10]|nr:MAG: hypothetical protein A4S17_09530 [Proteobacteria bacterium HN_bin10]
MRTLRTHFLALVALLIATPAFAREEITSFNVAIEVEQDGDIVVTETIAVIAEGAQIQRGIFRDLPRFYVDAENHRLAYDYRVLAVERDGREEPYQTDSDDNAFRIRIGDEDVFLDFGPHTYAIRYEVKNQIRYFGAYDELYWNVTGNYWAFPIRRARAAIALPAGAQVTQTRGYTGALGAAGGDYAYRVEGDRHIFETTRALGQGEGLTIAIGLAKGLIDPPSAADRNAILWQRYGALGVLSLSLFGLFWFLYRGFDRVGRDPPKGPVFPRYEPPAGYSPAAVHHIYHRAVSGHRALIATLMHLAIKGRIRIDASDKKNTTLTREAAAAARGDIAGEDLALEDELFHGSRIKSLGGSYDSGFTAAYQRFHQLLGRKYGSDYFRWNIGYTIVAIVLTVAAIAIASIMVVEWTGWHTLAVAALAALNLAFLYFIPAPTPKGQAVRTEIEGFRLYMEKAEKLQLNAAEPGSQAPPPMTIERYEKFLPYAVALGVEEPWTKHFERLIPEEAAKYNPGWSNMRGSDSLGSVTNSMIANMSSGVSSALPQSSSSSGSGGGGSSGGGGGGGGGGGW